MMMMMITSNYTPSRPKPEPQHTTPQGGVRVFQPLGAEEVVHMLAQGPSIGEILGLGLYGQGI